MRSPGGGSAAITLALPLALLAGCVLPAPAREAAAPHVTIVVAAVGPRAVEATLSLVEPGEERIVDEVVVPPGSSASRETSLDGSGNATVRLSYAVPDAGVEATGTDSAAVAPSDCAGAWRVAFTVDTTGPAASVGAQSACLAG
jgi:hypothetical protein